MTVVERVAADVDPSPTDIAALPDPVVRNLWITQRYHQLAVDLGAAGAGADATWCAFAVWASRTAGITIRGQELPRRVQRLLAGDHTACTIERFNTHLETALVRRLTHDRLVGLVAKVSADVSATIAAGNVLVFRELAPVFDALLAGWNSGDHSERGRRPALDAARSVTADPAPLETAVRSYWAALAEPDPKVRAGLVFTANVAAVAHEQQRLQPAIAAALDAAIRDGLQELVDDHLVPHLPGPTRRLADRLAGEVFDGIDRLWQTALTELVMYLATADEELDLRDDVPPLRGVMFPAELQPVVGPEGAEQLRRWDRTGGTGKGSGAHDWEVIDERMNYIVNLFRSRQRHRALLRPPFSDDQLGQMRDGRLPSGPL